MNLPDHKQDLIDLQNQIAEKLKALDVPVLSLNHTTEWDNRRVIPTLPDNLEQYEVSFTTIYTSSLIYWQPAMGMKSWSAHDWAAIKTIGFRRKAPVLKLDGETKINGFNGLIPLPSDIGDYEFQWTGHYQPDFTGWLEGGKLKMWAAGSWNLVDTIKLRKKLPKEQKLKVEVEFTTYVPGVTKFRDDVAYQVIVKGCINPFYVRGKDIKYPENILSYRFLTYL